jgi:Ca-activated chloride channel family protein
MVFLLEFGAPENLVLIWLVPLVVLVCFFAEKIRKKRLRLVGIIRDEPFGKHTPPTSFFRWLVKTMMLSGAALCLVLAVAKPRWGFEWIDAKQRGADIMIAVDVSKSMLAPDVSPSRLERARRKVSDLLDRMSGDRVGLVAFAGTSFVQCPLTMDYGAVRLFLSYLDPELIPTQGTDLGSAIDMSLAGLFDGAPEGTTTGRAIIIMTDGEDQEGRGLKAAEAAKAKGVKIYTMTIGSEEGSPIHEPGGGFKKDRIGNMVISKPNESAVKALSLATGGSHVRSVAGDGDIEALYDNGILKEIDRFENQEIRTKRWHERFQWFLAAALFLLFLEPLVRDVRGIKISSKPKAAKGIHALGLMVLALAALTLSERGMAASMSEAHKYYTDKDYEKAAKAFSELEKEEPDNPEVTYNRAVSQYRNGDFQGASEGFGRSAGAKDKALQEKSWYNLGNSLSYMQKFKEAVDAYENTLKLNPENVKAKENLELVKKLLEQQKEQQKQNQNQKQDDKDKKEGEQEDQQDQDGQQQKDQQQSEEQKGQEVQEKEKQSGQEGEQKENQSQGQENQTGETKPDEKKEGDKGQQSEAEKKDEEGKGKDEQQQKKSAEEDKNANEKEESQSGDNANHNQEGGQELKQSKTYSTDQAKQLLRSVEDKIKTYRYMEQSGTSQQDDPEKDW